MDIGVIKRKLKAAQEKLSTDMEPVKSVQFTITKKVKCMVFVKILQGQENASMIVFMNMEKFFLEVDYSILLKN